MPTVDELAEEFAIPYREVVDLVDAALTQFEVQVSDYLRGDRLPGVDSVEDLDDLIIANALDIALPPDVDRSVAREMLHEVVDPRLERVEEDGSFDPGEAALRAVEDNFPLDIRDEIERRMGRF